MFSLCRQTDGQANGQTDRWMTVNQYVPDLSMPGHKKSGQNSQQHLKCYFVSCFSILFVLLQSEMHLVQLFMHS